MFLYIFVYQIQIMYPILLILHSFFRWLVLISLCYCTARAWVGYTFNRSFSKTDNAWRHWTATIAHVQLILGMMLYLKSPAIRSFFTHIREATEHTDSFFFGCIHSLLMLISIVILTIGSALAKRKEKDHEKFKTLLCWYATALLIIFLAIPWPFSPLANRPYLRNF